MTAMVLVSKSVLAAVLGLLAVLLAGCGNSSTCSLEHCSEVSSNGDCSTASCQKCDDGFSLFSDSVGGYCAATCPVQNCATLSAPPRKTEACSPATAKCSTCSSGFELQLDANWNPTGQCLASCSNDQVVSGCEPQSCNSDGSCNACLPGFVLAPVEDGEMWDGEVVVRRLRGNTVDGPQKCTKAKTNVPMNFYMYRSQSASSYPPTNTDLASAAGVMWYLHNEVVARQMSCICDTPTNCENRHYDITRVLRYKVTVYNTEQVHAARGGQLGPYVQFDNGMCTLGNCENVWAQYGYQVGCQRTANSHIFQNGTVAPLDYGSSSIWYSLPGPCPILKYNDPNKKVCSDGDRNPGSKFQNPRPGGDWCDNHTHAPDGTNACTWSVEDAGEISLDDLAGIADHKAFCAAGNYEFDDDSDVGKGNSFWNYRTSKQHNLDRVTALLRLFALRHPEKDNKLAEPQCDF